MPLQIARQRPSRSNRLALGPDTTFRKSLDTATTCAEHFCLIDTTRVDGVKPPQDAESAQVQEVGLVVLETRQPHAHAAPRLPAVLVVLLRCSNNPAERWKCLQARLMPCSVLLSCWQPCAASHAARLYSVAPRSNLRPPRCREALFTVGFLRSFRKARRNLLPRPLVASLGFCLEVSPSRRPIHIKSHLGPRRRPGLVLK